METQLGATVLRFGEERDIFLGAVADRQTDGHVTERLVIVIAHLVPGIR